MEMFITQVGGFLASTMLFYMLDLDNSNACGKMQVFQWCWVRATCFMHINVLCSILNPKKVVLCIICALLHKRRVYPLLRYAVFFF